MGEEGINNTALYLVSKKEESSEGDNPVSCFEAEGWFTEIEGIRPLLPQAVAAFLPCTSLPPHPVQSPY